MKSGAAARTAESYFLPLGRATDALGRFGKDRTTADAVLFSQSFRPTAHTIGPWDPKLMHGGPISGLLARCAEIVARHEGINKPNIVRVAFGFYRPLQLVDFNVEVSMLRTAGKASHMNVVAKTVPAKESDEAKVLVQMFAVCIRQEEVPDVPPAPEAAYPKNWFPREQRKEEIPYSFPVATDLPQCYSKSLECRVKKVDRGMDDAGMGDGPTAIRYRQKIPLLPDEELTGLQRVLVVCDSAGGTSWYVDFMSYLFLNADMTVNILRPLEGEWVGMRSKTILNPKQGTGLASADLFDDNGFVGYSTQSQVLQSRM